MNLFLVATSAVGTRTVFSAKCYQSRRELIRLFDHEDGRADVPVSFVLEVQAGGHGFLTAILF